MVDHLVRVACPEGGFDSLSSPALRGGRVTGLCIGESSGVVQPDVVGILVTQSYERFLALGDPSSQYVTLGDVGPGVGFGPVPSSNGLLFRLDGLVVAIQAPQGLVKVIPGRRQIDLVGRTGMGDQLVQGGDFRLVIALFDRSIHPIIKQANLATRLEVGDLRQPARSYKREEQPPCRLGPSRVGPGFLPPTSRLRRQGPSPLLRKGDKGETPVGEG